MTADIHNAYLVCFSENDLASFVSDLAVNYVVWQWARKSVGNPDRRHDNVLLQCAVRQDFLHATTVTFLHISRKPSLRSWTWVYRQKANEKTFPTLSCQCRNIVNLSHTSLIHFCLTMHHWNEWGEKLPNPPPLPLAAYGLPSNTSIPTPLTTPNKSLIG